MDEKTVVTSDANEIELELLAKRFEARFSELAVEKRSLVDQLRIQSDKVLRLEAENVRLKMQRTDAELASQVDGLRAEVGKKDRELSSMKKMLNADMKNLAEANRRATAAEQHTATVQSKLIAIQRRLDAEHAAAEQSERDRLDAVRKMVDAQDRANRAEARVAELLNKEAPKSKKK